MGAKANHHFVPQFYLRCFAVGVGRKARVFVFDSQSKTTFRTLVRNVGSKRYFNRIEADGVDPNALEDSLAEIESLFAGHLSDVIAAKAFPTPDHFNSMMNLMATLSVRNPRLRAQLENWSSPGLMDTFSLMKESVFHAENEEPVPDGIQGTIGCAGASRSQC